MPEISYAEAASPPSGYSSGLVWALAPLIQAEACAFYNTYPQWVLYTPLGSADPLTPVRRNLWENLCPSSPKPPVPPAPTTFTGGQCPGVSYHAVMRFHLPNIPGGYAEFGSLVGPISVVYTFHSSAPSPVCAPGEVSVDTEIGLHDSYFGYHLAARGGGCEPVFYWILDSLVLTRNDGLPDTCGDPPVMPVPVPPGPPTPIPPTTVSFTGTNGDVYNFELQLNYNPTANPTYTDLSSHNYYTDPNFNINYTVNNSFNVSLNHYGFNFNFGDNAANNSNVANTNTGLAIAAGNAASSAATSAADNAASANTGVTKVIAVQNTCCNNSTPTKPRVNTTQPIGKNKNTGVSQLYGVSIVLTTVPNNSNEISGGGNPDIYFAGWIEFSAGAMNFPRQQINFLEGIFLAPNGADGYAITYKLGYAGQCTEIQNQT